jgi:hypothetical protein
LRGAVPVPGSQQTSFEKGALASNVTTRHELTWHQIVIIKMDPHLAKLFLVLLTLGFAIGFVSGYGIRAGISYYRHSIAKWSRLLH